VRSFGASGPSGGAGPSGPPSLTEVTELTEPERRVLDAVDVDRLLADVRALVGLPTHGGNETPAQELVAGWLAELGMALDRWTIDVDRLSTHPAYSAEIERDAPLGVVGTFPGRRGAAPPSQAGPAAASDRGDRNGVPDASAARSLLLNGHVDVVPPGDPALWSHPPFEAVVENGRVFGRGALDMKGPLCTGIAALRALADAGVRLRGDVLVASVVGEEDGGMGTLATIERGHRADGAVVLEPTELAVAPALAGAQNFRVRVPGQDGQGAVREEGVSAIENTVPILLALRELETERNRDARSDPLFRPYAIPFAICVGTIRGGDWASSVADHVAFEGRLGVSPDEAPSDARASLERAVAEAAAAHPWMRDHPPAVEWWGGRFEAARTDPDHPLITTLTQTAALVTGHPPDVRAMTYGADAGLLANHGGMPTVLFGPGDIRHAHRPDEWVAVNDLVTAARTVALLAMRFCGAAT